MTPSLPADFTQPSLQTILRINLDGTQRKKHYEKGERKKRTHRLCNLGGTVESLAPEVKDLTRTEMTELMEHIFSLSEVQRAVRHMAITHISQANREKELKADGTISSERHAD